VTECVKSGASPAAVAVESVVLCAAGCNCQGGEDREGCQREDWNGRQAR